MPAGPAGCRSPTGSGPRPTCDLLPAFVRRLATAFGAGAATADFRDHPADALARINGWVADHTAGKITGLFAPGSVGPGTTVVLANAVHFVGRWAVPFEPGRTHDAPFHLGPGGGPDTTVPMMATAIAARPVCRTPAADVVELPYAGDGLSMLVVIPTAVDGLPAVEHALTGATIAAWAAGLQPTRADVRLPRFKAAARYDLRPALIALGMPDAFDPTRADFSAMVAPSAAAPRVFIGGAVHQAVVAVDEQGTEAAAATGIHMMAAAMRVEPPSLHLVADRPFLYLIRDRRTGTVLFIGRCADPRS